MKKAHWLVVLGISIFLGLGISLSLNGIAGYGIQKAVETSSFSNENPLIKITPALRLPKRAGFGSYLRNTSEAFLTSTPDPRVIEPARMKQEENENVLLIYDSDHLSGFAINFCKIADFYGLRCKRVDLQATPLNDSLLRDSYGAYFRLIGLDASILIKSERHEWLKEITLLNTAVVSGGSNLLISKVSVDGDIETSELTELTDGAVLGAVELREAHFDWIVSNDIPEVTKEFSGQIIRSGSATTQNVTALLQINNDYIIPILSTLDSNGTSLPVFIKYSIEAGAIYIDAGQPMESLDQVSLHDIYYEPSNFSQIIPLMMTMRTVMGEAAWHSNYLYANMTIDGALLKEPFQMLSYIELLREMLVHNFHTTIAYIPAKWQDTQPEVVSLFKHYPDRFSLIQKGNNADGYEFYRYKSPVEEKDQQFIARPFAAQLWDIQEGISRMELLRSRTGLSFDPVMVFPVGISPAQTLQILKSNNYLATVNERDIPLDSIQPVDWNYGMYPATIDNESFPLLTRRNSTRSQSIQPFIFDLFLGKPALFYSTASPNGIFMDGMAAFDPIVDQVNNLPSSIEWQSLGEIFKRLYLEKTNRDGSIDIRMYTNHLILENESPADRTYHISKRENLNVPISKLTVNGRSFSYTIVDGYLMVDIMVSGNSSAEIKIEYKQQ